MVGPVQPVMAAPAAAAALHAHLAFFTASGVLDTVHAVSQHSGLSAVWGPVRDA